MMDSWKLGRDTRRFLMVNFSLCILKLSEADCFANQKFFKQWSTIILVET